MTDKAEETIDLSDGGTRESSRPQSSERADKLQKNSAENFITFNQFDYPDWPSAFRAAERLISKGSAAWWNETNIVLLDDDTKEFRLSTTCCGQEFAVANPSRFWTNHKKICKGKTDIRGRQVITPAPTIKDEIGDSICAGPSRQGNLHSFGMSQRDQQRFIHHFVRGLIVGNVPFTFMENEDIMKAASIAGVKLPSRKVTSTTVLDQLFDDVEVANAAKLEQVDLFDATSDGWRKKYCEKGDAMQNFCVLLDSQAMQFDVKNVASERKSGDAIAAILESMACQMTSGNMDKLIGWILDNTKANWAAMQKLQSKYPKWLMRGCLAHSLNALMKDICTYKKGTGQRARESTFGLEWAEKVVMLCNKLSNFMQDSSIAKSMVNEAQVSSLKTCGHVIVTLVVLESCIPLTHWSLLFALMMHVLIPFLTFVLNSAISTHFVQVQEYGNRRSIEVHAPTRWASNFKVVKSVQNSKQALQTAVRSQAWSGAFSGDAATTAQLIKDVVENTWKASRNAQQPFYFWEKVELFIELMQPFSDAIHQLEADLPFLSQAWPVLHELQQHVAEFIEDHTDEAQITERLQETFDRRWELRTGALRAPILNASYFAAHMLDPAFAKENAFKILMMPQIPPEFEREAADLVRRVGGSAAGDAFEALILNGWPDSVKAGVQSIVNQVAGAKRDASGKSVGKPKMPAMRQRLNLWARYATTSELLKPLSDVAQRLLRAHVTAAATERGWSMWGRVYNATRSSLAQERAKKMIAICSDAKSQKLSTEREFQITLQVIEQNVD